MVAPGLTPAALAALAAVVLVAFTVEAALGFGATLISVAIGSLLLPIPALLPALVPLNLGLSVYLASRYWRDVDRRFLFGRLLPLMGLGLPFGLACFRAFDSASLRRLFGAFLVVVSTAELVRMRRTPGGASRPMPRPLEATMLFAGGLVHGAFATGGPMAVYVASRAIHDKGRYRATLSVLWALLNVVLLLTYAVGGELGPSRLALCASLAPCCLLGLALGEFAHRRIPTEVFRAAVFVGLALAGAALLGQA